MVQSKQPVIQSVFDRRLVVKDDTFFLKAITELESYRREISCLAVTTPEYKELVKNRDDRVAALESIFVGMCAAENILSGVVHSFDILSEESFF